MMKSMYAKIGLSIGLCMILGFMSGMSTTDAIANWYVHLEKPPFNPPNWIFGPVWTILYIMMGIAVGRVWHIIRQSGTSMYPVYLFVLQFILNLMWSYLFFVRESPMLGLIDIGLLWILIIMTIVTFAKIDTLSSRLLWPYLAWVTFATLLNASIWYLN